MYLQKQVALSQCWNLEMFFQHRANSEEDPGFARMLDLDEARVVWGPPVHGFSPHRFRFGDIMRP
jgi:hypothetical protein